ncbi:MAG TPA: serine/threonine-protein kinase [Kofleriaceae bacterium]|nr:serine/threonine-protein kinase [Kofleriaceae bacterium]
MYGPFEVMERLGIGGMATVHRALERGIEGFERIVALKRLLPHLAEDEQFVRAFVREAKLASLLAHGNIVQLYELGRVGASYFISMEYIRGRDLRQILRQAKRVTGPPPLAMTVGLVSEMLDALDYAHQRCDEDGQPLGLVHRDVSPSNLIVSHTGHLKVIDFGIATASLGRLATDSGRIKGKLSYMAPEALAGAVLDGRSDLFSASIIAHELLTAHPLFAARNDVQTIDRVRTMEAPRPSARNPHVPPELDAWVLRGLSKDPAERWHSASEMRAGLADVVLKCRLHSTNREVADWVTRAFGIEATRPTVVEPLLVKRRQTTEAGETLELEEITDVVWAARTNADALPVIIEGVPDAGERGHPQGYVTFRTPLPRPPAMGLAGAGAASTIEADMDEVLVVLPEAPVSLPPSVWAAGTRPATESGNRVLPLRAPPDDRPRRLARASSIPPRRQQQRAERVATFGEGIMARRAPSWVWVVWLAVGAMCGAACGLAGWWMLR